MSGHVHSSAAAAAEDLVVLDAVEDGCELNMGVEELGHAGDSVADAETVELLFVDVDVSILLRMCCHSGGMTSANCFIFLTTSW